MFQKIVTKLLRVHDGDTFYCDIIDLPPLFGKNIGVRVRGIDAYELKSKDPMFAEIALQTKIETTKVLSAAKEIKLCNITRGKYFRLIADVKFDGVDLAEWLLNKGLVRKY